MPSIERGDGVALDDVLRGGAAADAGGRGRRPAAAAAAALEHVGDQVGHRGAAGVLGRGERRRTADLDLDVADGHVHHVLDRRQALPAVGSASASKSIATTSGNDAGWARIVRAACT